MVVSYFLQQHAIRNIWCTPEQDKQAIIKPVRYGKVRGVYERIKIGWDELKVPTTENYIVYQIGHHPPSIFGLNGVTNQWKKLDGLSTASKCTINIYNGKGVLLPLGECFIIQLDNKAVLLAIRENPRVNMVEEDIWFHHYANAFWGSSRASTELDFWVESVRRTNTNEPEVLVLYNKWYTAKVIGKRPQLLHNGKLVDKLPPSQILVGDTIEVRVDDSLDEIHDISIDELNYNYSTMDNVRKYIVDLGVSEVIKYHDDIEISIVKLDADGNSIEGVLLHRNQPANVRMLASATYSISVDQVEYLRQHIADGNCHIRMYVRKSGWDRRLVFENSRLHELNKLPHEQRHQVITGKSNPCELWTLDALEKSAYPKVMRLRKIDSSTTIDLYRCYGYNAAAYYGADNQMFPDGSSGVRRISIPEVYRKGSLVEYDADGLLVDIKPCREDGISYPEDATQVIEFFQDEFLSNCPDYYNTEVVPSGHREYRFYHRLKGTQEWHDITHAVSYTNQGDGFLKHNYNSPNHEWVIRYSDWAWSRTFTTPLRQGVAEISLIDDTGTVELPFRYVIVRLNGYELIQDIDFKIYRQSIWISAKRYLNDDGDNEVSIIAHGFPEDDDTGSVGWGKPDRVGWVDHGLISKDDRYDLHSGKLFRPVVDGKYVMRADVEHHEDSTGVKGNMRNGAPYAITFVKPRLQAIGIPVSAEKSLRTDAINKDKIVSDYMTLHAVIPSIPNVSPIPYRHQLYSVFTARILDDLVSGVLTIPNTRILDSTIKAMVKHHEYLLPVDAAYTGVDGAVEAGLASVRPHSQDTTIEVSQKIYSFMDRISTLYLNGRVDMTGHLIINTGGE